VRNVGAWIVAGAVLLSIFGTACSRREDSRQLAALESAYKSGVLTKSEYQERKLALETQAAPLAALDKALASGVLTRDEYEARKARLMAQTGALAALEKARGAGVLTNDEYLARKAALLASGAPAPPSSPDPSPGAAPSLDAAAPPSASAEQPNAPPFSAPPVPAGSVPDQPATAAGAPSSAPAAAAGDPQGHSYRMKVVKAVDQYGFEHPIVSVSMLVPVDWQSQGATTWNIKDACNGIQTTLRATGPDGRAYEVFPAFNWVWADDPRYLQQAAAQKAQMGTHPCDVMPPMSAQDYLRRNLARIRPNAQLAGLEPAPKLMESLHKQAQQTEQMARQFNLKQQVKVDAIKARVRYTLDGKPVEEWISAATVITGTVGPSLNLQTMQQVQKWGYSCVAYMGAMRAPQGQLDANQKFFELLASTYHWNPEWQNRLAGHAQAMQKIELKGIRDRSAIVAKSAEETSNIRRQAFENQQKTEDQMSTQFSQYQRGVETYRNPSSGETVDLDNNYGHAWVNNKGEYLLSDQAGFDPNTIFKNNEDWKPLEHVKQ